ncbi:MAG: glycosyltransferase family 4 protein [Ferruginibacter sp.]
MFARLSKRGKIAVKVFYTWGKAAMQEKYDPGFNKNIEWDIPLLEGYEFDFVTNTASKPGSHHFTGINNPGLIRDIEDWQADFVLVFGWAFKSHLKAICYFHKKIPVIFRGDSTLLAEKSWLKKISRTVFLKWVYRHVDLALYVGSHNKNYFLHHGLTSKQLLFAPHAVDNYRFSIEHEKFSDEASKWREKLNIGNQQIVFLFAAKLDDNKNAGLLINSFISLNNPDTHLIIAGSGDKENDLYSLYKESKNIHFLPFQNQSVMPVLYRVGDVFVVPSRSETWGLSINEAMACGRALLVSDKCGAAVDLVKDGVNGFIFRSDDETDLRIKMEKCALSKDQLISFGTASLKMIASWNYTTSCETIEAVVKKTWQNIDD